MRNLAECRSPLHDATNVFGIFRLSSHVFVFRLSCPKERRGATKEPNRSDGAERRSEEPPDGRRAKPPLGRRIRPLFPSERSETEKTPKRGTQRRGRRGGGRGGAERGQSPTRAQTRQQTPARVRERSDRTPRQGRRGGRGAHDRRARANPTGRTQNAPNNRTAQRTAGGRARKRAFAIRGRGRGYDRAQERPKGAERERRNARPKSPRRAYNRSLERNGASTRQRADDPATKRRARRHATYVFRLSSFVLLSLMERNRQTETQLLRRERSERERQHLT